ncbi:phage head morphogenesis protein [Shigella sonnei]|nr:phage head morphogenesis protein [Shigella sonnei]
MPRANKIHDVDLSYAIGLPPKEAIRYFESKGYTIGFNWHDVEARTHARAFTVAGVLKLDVLQDIRQGLTDSLKNGTTLRQFEDAVLPVLRQKGWIGKGLVADEDGVLEGKQLLPRRLKTIFETNMQSAYNAGRYEAQLANAESRPYWERIAVMDSVTRPRHAALNGFIARYDDPVWQFMYPPDGYGCRCRVRARSATDVTRHDLQVQSSEGRIETIEQAWGPNETREVQALRINGQLYAPDAGFGHNPGQGYLSALGQRLMTNAAKADPKLASLAVHETLADPELMSAINAGVRRWVDHMLVRGSSATEYAHVGALSPTVLNAVEARHTAITSSVMRIASDEVRRAPNPLWGELPALLRNAELVLQDADRLVYVVRHNAAHYRCLASPTQNGFTLSLPDNGASLTSQQEASLRRLPVLSGAWYE